MARSCAGLTRASIHFPKDGLPGHAASRRPGNDADIAAGTSNRHNNVQRARPHLISISDANEMEDAMRVFILALVAAATIASGGYIGLSRLQVSSAEAFTTGSARLDWQERSNMYGRELPAPGGAAQ
jgi:hypothetical protein